MDPVLKMYFHVTYPTFNASYDLARNCLSVLPFIVRDMAARGFQLISLFLLVKYVLECGVGHTWQRTSAFLIYERFHGR